MTRGAKRCVLLCAGMLLSACGVIEDSYSTLRGEAECKKIRTCQRGLFEFEYRDDLQICTDKLGDRLDARAEALLSECVYDPKEAARCLSRIRGLSCEAFVEGRASDACDRVYDCRGVGSDTAGAGTIGTEPTGQGPTETTGTKGGT